jgi:hypothetical protein
MRRSTAGKRCSVCLFEYARGSIFKLSPTAFATYRAPGWRMVPILGLGTLRQTTKDTTYGT